MKEIAVILIILSVFTLGLFVAYMIYEGEYEVGKVLKECESKLPRNENCIIIAVPEKNKG